MTQLVHGQAEWEYQPNFAIKFNVLGLVAHTPGIELGVEHTIGKDRTIHLAGAYLSDFGIFTNKNFEGYKLVGEYRFYDALQTVHENSYLALQFNLKKAFAEGRAFVDRANGNFQELVDATVENTSLDFLLAVGAVEPLLDWLSLDVSVVGGVKRLTLSSDDITDDAIFSELEPPIINFTMREFGSRWYPVFRVQLKLNFEF